MITGFRFKSAVLTTCGARDIFLKPGVVKGNNLIYSFLEKDDLMPTDRRYLQDVYGDIPVINFPIRDYGIPESMSKFNALIEKILFDIKSGKNVLIHCYGGTGRTGLVIVGIFTKIMKSSEEAYKLVSKRRKALETSEQIQFIKDYEIWLRNS